MDTHKFVFIQPQSMGVHNYLILVSKQWVSTNFVHNF
jgi:hypothetical protein